MNAGSGVDQIFTSMTIYTSHRLEAYPITRPPPKRVSDRMCPAVIHESHLHGEHSKFLMAKKSETNLCRNAAAKFAKNRNLGPVNNPDLDQLITIKKPNLDK